MAGGRAKTRTGLLALAWCTAITICQPADGQTQNSIETATGQTADCNKRPGEPHAIVRITDASTVVLDDGRTVLLAGVISPPPPSAVPIPASGWEPGLLARSAMSDLTATGTAEISIEQNWRDRHGRASAQIYISRGTGRIWLQHALVEQGHVIVSSRHGGGACAADLLAAEDTARKAKRGLWANATYRVHPANDPSALRRLRSNFALIEGTVVNVASRSGRLFLNFGNDWKTDFTAVVPAHLLKAAPQQAKALANLAGHTIRVRGWNERRYGPSIEIFDLSDIEDLAPTTVPSATPAQEH
jgi:micrococcal nuclease